MGSGITGLNGSQASDSHRYLYVLTDLCRGAGRRSADVPFEVLNRKARRPERWVFHT